MFFAQSDEVSNAWLNNELVRNAIHAQPVQQGACSLCHFRLVLLQWHGN